jgi:hypothetical protein
MTPAIAPAPLAHRPQPVALPCVGECVSHDVAWCAPPMYGYSYAATAGERDAVAAGGAPPPGTDNAVIFPLAFMLGAS